MSRAHRRQEQRAAATAVRRSRRKLPELPEPAEGNWSSKEALVGSISLAGAVLALASRKSVSSDSVFVPSNALRKYTLMFGGIGLMAGFSGTLVYFLFGGRRYFNPWFLFGMPAVAAVTGLAAVAGVAIVARFSWRKEADRRREHALVSTVSVPLVLSTPLWLLLTLRLLFPSFDQGLLLLALPGFGLGLFCSVRWVSAYFRTRVWMGALLGVGGAYLLGLYFAPFAAAWLVRLLRL